MKFEMSGHLPGSAILMKNALELCFGKCKTLNYNMLNVRRSLSLCCFDFDHSFFYFQSLTSVST